MSCCGNFVSGDGGGSGGGGGGGGDATVQAFTFQPGGANNGPSVFNSWATLYAALVAARTAAQGGGEFVVILDNSVTSPVVIPAGSYDLSNTSLRGVYQLGDSTTAQRVAVELAASVAITHLTLITGLVISNPATVGPEILVDGDLLETLTLECVDTNPTGPIFDFAGPGDVALFIGDGCDFTSASGVTSASAPLLVQINGAGSVVPSTAITIAGGGTVQYSLNNSASLFAGAYAPAADTTYVQNTAPITWPFEDGAVQTAGADADINTLVLVNGANDQAIALPSIQNVYNGKLIIIKEAAGAAGGIITITPGGAVGGIDGNAQVYITQRNESWTFLADVPNDTWRVINHVFTPLKAQRSTTVAIANTETQVLAFTAPPNTLRVGSVIRFQANASRTGANNVTPTFNIRIGPVTLTGTVVCTCGTIATGNAGGSHWEGQVIIQAIGVAGNAVGEMFSAINSAASAVVAQAGRTDAAAIDTTIANLVEITFLSGNAGNTYTFRTAAMWQHDRAA